MNITLKCINNNLLIKLALTFFIVITSLGASAQQLSGRLEWVDKIEMRVLEDGFIEKMNIKIGQYVKKGSTLLVMDQRKAKAELLKAKAMIARSKVEMDDADDELKRAEELYDRGLIADEELKDAKIKVAAVQAESESANAALALAEVTLDRNILRAPINGIIITKNNHEGGVIYKTQQREPLFTIAPSGKMLARILVSSQVLKRYKPGQKARVTVNGKHYNGFVYSQGVEAVRIEPKGAIYELDIIFNHNPQDLLRPSEIAKVTIH
ncbi:efflux RND transporter periplasmic adaptor subunit [Cocleimonas sp. KMM 6892]|uniref:efflux RND transporter periplasmic adaptor subunit n=1 Tax=unclassified Cocleimonas TaxID=2639732 RepID=UPI002DBCD826|nr:MULTISPECIES: efflux RND transporter periplasmic adaptor subunit [unclassified Cocleimonas]MEB8430771.1 efflux RND transporter periplasmic adaptor subunit [Cocleimonas sp. KMM 6892]MEC4714457.1 efflux RND transporter periplasmic adaptor subunit [Cocleimonas sp. KMM 6895]MEC4743790.1 efflux RND transporter periplasmic adaptor subunit [Cocleimonas sp. KMM 6896]